MRNLKGKNMKGMGTSLISNVMEKKKELQTKLVFADVFKIKTETEFNVDGTLTVIPVGWSEGDVRLSTPSGKKPPKIYGKMEYTLSGKAVFCPSKQTDKPRYNVLYSDKFLQIKETDKDMIFKIQAAKGYFATNKYAKPVIQSFDWAKTFIKDDIKARKNHGSKQNLLQGR